MSTNAPSPQSSADRETASADALPRIYQELRALAAHCLRKERPNHTLQPTALVHEAYLRLIGQRKIDWENRAQVIGLATQMMRRILINHAAARSAAKRGGGTARVSLDDALEVFEARAMPAPALDAALRDLEKLDARQAQIVELRFFGGLTVEEVADVLAISPATVKREWTTAKHWLRRELAA